MDGHHNSGCDISIALQRFEDLWTRALWIHVSNSRCVTQFLHLHQDGDWDYQISLGKPVFPVVSLRDDPFGGTSETVSRTAKKRSFVSSISTAQH